MMVMGFKKTHSEYLENQGVTIDIYDAPNFRIELLLSMYPDSPIGRFIKRHGSEFIIFVLRLRIFWTLSKILSKKHKVDWR